MRMAHVLPEAIPLLRETCVAKECELRATRANVL